MEIENRTNKQQSVSVSVTQTYKTTLSTAVVKAFARTGKDCSQESVNLITSDIIDEYNNLPIEIIIEALKKGGRGKYGRTYSLSVQEVCIWIDSYLKEDEKEIDNDLYSYFRYDDDHYLTIRRRNKRHKSNLNHIDIDTNKIGNRNKQW